MTGRVLLRCPACCDLAYDPREGPTCETCGYQPTCANCGTNIDPRDYDDEDRGACSPTCAHIIGLQDDADLIT